MTLKEIVDNWSPAAQGRIFIKRKSQDLITLAEVTKSQPTFKKYEPLILVQEKILILNGIQYEPTLYDAIADDWEIVDKES